MNVISSRPLTVSEAKSMLDERGKEIPLESEQIQASEHAERFNHHDADTCAGLVKELVKEKKLDPEIATKIVDISPTHTETLKAVLVMKRIEMSDDDANELVKTLRK